MRIGARNGIVFALILSPVSNFTVFANDSAASIAVGGIQLRSETRISMEKERLTISAEKVTFDYEFLNETDKDTTIEVAFPVPPYDGYYVDASFPKQLDDFRVWVEGRETKYHVDAKAILNGMDYGSVLRKMGVDVASLGHFTDSDPKRDPYSPDIEKLPRPQREELKKLGLIRGDNGFMGWTVVKAYHWTQTFPARKILHIRHVYAPVLGFELLNPEVTVPVPREERSQEFTTAIRDACIDTALQSTLTSAARKEESCLSTFWIDYILTTANTWKKPIKRFELIVERPASKARGTFEAKRWLVSFCWDGPLKAVDANHFAAESTNFVPKRELHIVFFGVN